MTYNFKEKALPTSFAKEKMRGISVFLKTSSTFLIVGIPSVGVSLFLKFLTTREKGFVYFDAYNMVVPSQRGFFMLLAQTLGARTDSAMTEQDLVVACKNAIKKLLKKQNHLTLIINRFELMEPFLTQQFLGTLRLLPHEFGKRILCIYALTRPIAQTHLEALSGGNSDLFSKYYFFTPYAKKDLQLLLALHNPELSPTKHVLEKMLTLSGGHFQLLQLLLKSEKGKVDPLRDPFIHLLFDQIYQNFSYEQKRELRSLALGKRPAAGSYLQDIGVINKKGEFFSPLFQQFLIGRLPLRLPAKETLLFHFLKKAKGEVVSKEAIFQAVWPKNPEEATDWALDSLIYRLRKNPIFQKSGYQLENYKKQGYLLVRII